MCTLRMLRERKEYVIITTYARIVFIHELFTPLDLFLSDLVNENSSVSILKRQNTKTFYDVFLKTHKNVFIFFFS